MLRPAASARRGQSPLLLSPAPPPSWFGGAVAVAARRERRRSGRAGLRLLACLLSEQLDLGAAQGTNVAWPHARDRDAAIIGAVQPDHWRADRLHQPLDEVGPPFRDDEARPGIAGRAALHGGFESLGAAVLEPHAGDEPRDLLGLRYPGHLGEIGATNAVARVHELVREVAVVRDQERSLGVVIEAADRVDALVDAHEVLRDGRTALGIGERGDGRRGLVEQEIDLVLRLGDDAAVHADDIVRGVGFGAELANDRAVQLDAALLDELLRLPPRSDAGVREDFLPPVAQDEVSVWGA